MAPVPQTTPRKDGKTQEQVDAEMEAHLNTYYVTDEERTFDGAGDTNVAPASVSKPKAKRPARKHSPKSKSVSEKSDVQSSPLTRKSARVASKRAAAEAYGSDEGAEQDQQPAKRIKMSPASKTTTATPAKKPTTATPAKKANVSPAAATIQKTTVRPSPISTELPKAKYVEKQSTASDAANENGDDETEVDDDEDQETIAKGGKGKGKKPAVKAFQGAKSGFGTSVQKPEDAPLDEPWKCANRDCNSGQTYHPRDGPNSFGRKVISNFFGRNKKETNLIDANVWHNYCRKCYQRGTYRVNVISNLEKVKYYISNIDMQLDRIVLWRPEATFTVQLSKGASARLAKYYKERTKHGATTASAQAAVTKTPETNSKGKVKSLSLEDAFPVDLLEHFEDNYTNADQSFTDLKLILNWVTNLAENGQIDSMPPMEFLINKKTDDEEVIDPATNYQRWCAHEDGVEFVDEDVNEDRTQEAGSDDDETKIAGNDEDDTEATGSADNQDTKQSGNDENETDVAGNDEDETEATGGAEDQDTKQAGNADARDKDAETDEESDADIKDAIGTLTQDAIGRLTQGAAGASGSVTNPANNDFYDDDDESDDDESDDEGLNELRTPSPPPKKPWRLTPTGIGSPIRPGQSSTYYITNRDLGPANLKSKPRKIVEDYNDSSSEGGSPYKKQSMWATNNTNLSSGALNKRKRDIEEEYSGSPSKKQNVSSTYDTNLSSSPGNKRKRDIDEESTSKNYNDSSAERGSSSQTQYMSDIYNAYLSPGAADKSKRNIDEEYNNQNYNDTTSEGGSPSKKQKL